MFKYPHRNPSHQDSNKITEGNCISEDQASSQRQPSVFS